MKERALAGRLYLLLIIVTVYTLQVVLLVIIVLVVVTSASDRLAERLEESVVEGIDSGSKDVGGAGGEVFWIEETLTERGEGYFLRCYFLLGDGRHGRRFGGG